jgi:hypothetical protein
MSSSAGKVSVVIWGVLDLGDYHEVFRMHSTALPAFQQFAKLCRLFLAQEPVDQRLQDNPRDLRTVTVGIQFAALENVLQASGWNTGSGDRAVVRSPLVEWRRSLPSATMLPLPFHQLPTDLP